MQCGISVVDKVGGAYVAATWFGGEVGRCKSRSAGRTREWCAYRGSERLTAFFRGRAIRPSSWKFACSAIISPGLLELAVDESFTILCYFSFFFLRVIVYSHRWESNLNILIIPFPSVWKSKRDIIRRELYIFDNFIRRSFSTNKSADKVVLVLV